jgi:hypothetical protein
MGSVGFSPFETEEVRERRGIFLLPLPCFARPPQKRSASAS